MSESLKLPPEMALTLIQLMRAGQTQRLLADEIVVSLCEGRLEGRQREQALSLLLDDEEIAAHLAVGVLSAVGPARKRLVSPWACFSLVLLGLAMTVLMITWRMMDQARFALEASEGKPVPTQEEWVEVIPLSAELEALMRAETSPAPDVWQSVLEAAGVNFEGLVIQTVTRIPIDEAAISQPPSDNAHPKRLVVHWVEADLSLEVLAPQIEGWHSGQGTKP